ncbi:MAG: hypothetical protein M0005_16185 [Actinomycetota bacterium]|nr:hypothetical protein [Actinomycetota bacterium]
MANCTHGFPQGQCLICSTLARTAGGAGNTTTVADKPGSSLELEGLNGGPARTLARPKAGQPKGAGEEKLRGRGSTKSKLAVAVVVIVAGILAWGLFQGIFDLALRIAEYVVLAVAAGWVGYKVGHHQGRRETEHGKRRPKGD